MSTKQSITPFVWQKKQWQQLHTRLINQTMPHAILLTGAKGLGKLHFAQCLARSLLCINRQADGMACMECRQCLLIQAGNHPDLLQIHPSEVRHSIKIEQIRILSDVSAETSAISVSKVVIIEPAEAMTIAASNALLKSLEEPQGAVYFLLVSHEFSRLAATLVSRCQKIYFQASYEAATVQWIKEQLAIQNDAQHLLQWSFGTPLNALAMGEGTYQQERQDFMNDWVALLTGKIHAVPLCEKWHKYDILKVIDWILKWVTDLLHYYLTGKPDKFENNAIPAIYQFYDNLLKNKQFLAKSSAMNSQLLLEEIFIEGASLKTYGPPTIVA